LAEAGRLLSGKAKGKARAPAPAWVGMPICAMPAAIPEKFNGPGNDQDGGDRDDGRVRETRERRVLAS